MDSGMISQVYKAREYAQQPSRFSFEKFSVQFRGNNKLHTVTYDCGTWSCDCENFELREFCSHTMAIERLLEGIHVNLEGAQD